MKGHLMFGRVLDCHVVQPEMAHKDVFKNGNREWNFVPTQLIFRKKKNNLEKTGEEKVARIEGLLGKEKEKRDRIKELEIDY